MKKFLLLFILIITTATSFHSFAQCVPNTDTVSGIEPDTLAPAYVGVPYEEVIYFRLPHDTTVMFGPFELAIIVDSLVVDSVKGLPPTFSFACNNPSCSVLGGSNGCSAITGTATINDLGIHPLQVYVTTYISDTFGLSIGGVPDTVSFYFLDVQLPSGVSPLDIDEITVGNCFPNPASSIINVPITSLINSDVEISVLDVAGKELLKEIIPVKKGDNEIMMNVTALNEGLYLMKAEMGNTLKVMKFVVKK